MVFRGATPQKHPSVSGCNPSKTHFRSGGVPLRLCNKWNFLKTLAYFMVFRGATPQKHTSVREEFHSDFVISGLLKTQPYFMVFRGATPQKHPSVSGQPLKNTLPFGSSTPTLQ